MRRKVYGWVGVVGLLGVVGLVQAEGEVQGFKKGDVEWAGLTDYKNLHQCFLEERALSVQLNGLPLPPEAPSALYPAAADMLGCHWAYVTERHLLLHLMEARWDNVKKTFWYSSYLYTFVTPKENVDVSRVKKGERFLSEYAWILVDWVKFEEQEPLLATPYEFRGYLKPPWSPLPTPACVIPSQLFAAFNPHDKERHSPPLLSVWFSTKWLRCLALSDFLYGLPIYFTERGGFDWRRYGMVKIEDCMYNYHEGRAKGLDYRELPYAYSQIPYMYPILRSGYVRRSGLVEEDIARPKVVTPWVAATEFAKQDTYFFKKDIEDQIAMPMRPWNWQSDGYLYSWAYATCRNCIIHVMLKQYIFMETVAWTFTLVSMEMVDVEALKAGTKKIKDYEWVITGGVYYEGIDDYVYAYIDPEYEMFDYAGYKLQDLMRYRGALRRADFQGGSGPGGPYVKSKDYIRVILDHVAEPEVGLTTGMDWPSAESINDVLVLDYHEPARREQYKGYIENTIGGGTAVTTVEKSWKDDRAEVYFFHPNYSAYQNRVLYQRMFQEPERREEKFNLYGEFTPYPND